MKLEKATRGMIKGILIVAAIALVVGIVIISVMDARRPEEVVTTVTAIDEAQTETLAQVWDPVASGTHIGEERVSLFPDVVLSGGHTYRIIIVGAYLRLTEDAPDLPEPPVFVTNLGFAIDGVWSGGIERNDFAGERYRSGRVEYHFEVPQDENIYQFDFYTDLEYAEFWAMGRVVIERVYLAQQTRVTAPVRFTMTIGRPLLPQGIPSQVQYAIGLLIGAVASVAKVVLLERSIKKSMGKESKAAASGAMRVGYVSRYFLTAAVLLGVLFLMGLYGFVGAFAGTLTLAVSAYTARIFIKDDDKIPVEKGGDTA